MILTLLLSCSSALEPAPYSACDPLDPENCALPFPSTFFQTDDPATPTGQRLDLRDGTLPTNLDGAALDPSYWNEKDGFSTWGPLVFWFDDLDPAGLPPWDDLGASLGDGASVVLIDAETGERVPIWAELDGADSSDPAALVRLAEPMRPGTRHVVGIRGLRGNAGELVQASPGFAALRDGLPAESWDVEGRRDRYEDEVFPVLEAAGLDRGDLQLAWDFTTASESGTTARAEHMRDDARASWGDAGPAYEILSVEDFDCGDQDTTIGRSIEGELIAPLYSEADEPVTPLTRGDDGLPYQSGETRASFLIRIPCSVTEDPAPALTVQYGHGLLGSREEITQDYMGEMLDDFGWVMAAVDWTGLSSADRGPIALMMSEDASDFAVVPERTLQGFVEFDGLMALIEGPLGQDPALQIDGVSLIDPQRTAFYGISAGGILGAGYLGFSRRFERGVLGVPGAPFTTLLPRSINFEPFALILDTKYEDDREIAALMAAFQTLWDPAEAAGWARSLSLEPGDRPPVDVLLQTGTGDAQVSTLGAHNLARAVGAATVSPETRPVWGLDEQAPGFSGSALVEWDYADGSLQTGEPVPPEVDGDTHYCVRREPAAQEQVRIFLETGVIEHTCEGACAGVREGFCD